MGCSSQELLIKENVSRSVAYPAAIQNSHYYTATQKIAVVWKSVILCFQRTLMYANSTPSVCFATSATSGSQSTQKIIRKLCKNGCNIAPSVRNPSLHRPHHIIHRDLLQVPGSHFPSFPLFGRRLEFAQTCSRRYTLPLRRSQRIQFSS